MQQRFVIAGLELVGHDQEAVRILSHLVRDLAAGKAVQRRFGNLLAAHGPEEILNPGDERPLQLPFAVFLAQLQKIEVYSSFTASLAWARSSRVSVW